MFDTILIVMDRLLLGGGGVVFLTISILRFHAGKNEFDLVSDEVAILSSSVDEVDSHIEAASRQGWASEDGESIATVELVRLTSVSGSVSDSDASSTFIIGMPNISRPSGSTPPSAIVFNLSHLINSPRGAHAHTYHDVTNML